MSDDATLSDFQDAGDRDGSFDRANGDGADPDATSGNTDTPKDEGENGDGVGTTDDSTLSTFAWGEYTCTRCDRETERVWRDDGSFVCPDCKTW